MTGFLTYQLCTKTEVLKDYISQRSRVTVVFFFFKRLENSKST